MPESSEDDELSAPFYLGKNKKDLFTQPPFDQPFYRPPESTQELFKHFDQHLMPEDMFGDLPKADTARCYSCMSKFYEAVWPALSHVYKKPMNFTDSCNEEKIDKSKVPYTPCPTICVAMSEEATVGGMKIRGHIRGCLDDLLHNGFNQTIVSWYRWMHRDSCRIYRKRELFKLPPEQSDESSIQVCTCYADYCNSASSSYWPLFWLLFLAITVTLLR
ncbi:unnamed protein product [Bursaphelenchus okinawaensis]|uniref:Uncharacterized protein n=1 Tax=Bursaphelenchus okinawaensis TaxID=465554 RepID=A0A811LAG1_9BILA|nr:unnamed protein product [Bursaphelenchus okinawaensis]CAG9119588.1 unnamed protein product [Bursaphelenchus okinawaensis]